MYRDSHHLQAAQLADLHPTQISVGLAEVVAKRAEWARLKRRARAHLLSAHWFPAVKGPGGRFYIVDHHHLGLALLQEQISQVWVMQLDDFSELKGETFWRLMEFAAGRIRTTSAGGGAITQPSRAMWARCATTPTAASPAWCAARADSPRTPRLLPSSSGPITSACIRPWAASPRSRTVRCRLRFCKARCNLLANRWRGICRAGAA